MKDSFILFSVVLFAVGMIVFQGWLVQVGWPCYVSSFGLTFLPDKIGIITGILIVLGFSWLRDRLQSRESED